MVDPEKAVGYQKRVHALMDKYGLQPSQITYRKPVAVVEKVQSEAETAVEENTPKPEKKRWKLW